MLFFRLKLIKPINSSAFFKFDAKFSSYYSNKINEIKNEQKKKYIRKKENLRLIIKQQEKLVKKKIEIMKENIYTIPNGLTSIRILLTPFLGYCIIDGKFNLALYMFVFAGITDLLDGSIARNYPKQKSFLGSVLDPIADKFLISTMFITLTVIGTIPLYLTLLTFARDLILLSCGAYLRYVSLPKPKTIYKFFDPSLATLQVKPTFLSKMNTAVQISFIAYSLLSNVLDINNAVYFDNFCIITALSTIISGSSYLFSKNTYKMY